MLNVRGALTQPVCYARPHVICPELAARITAAKDRAQQRTQGHDSIFAICVLMCDSSRRLLPNNAACAK